MESAPAGRAGERLRAITLRHAILRSEPMPITITLPDGSALQLEAGATGATAARTIGRRLAEAAVAVRVDGELRDLAVPLPDGAKSRSSLPTATRGGPSCATRRPT